MPGRCRWLIQIGGAYDHSGAFGTPLHHALLKTKLRPKEWPRRDLKKIWVFFEVPNPQPSLFDAEADSNDSLYNGNFNIHLFLSQYKFQQARDRVWSYRDMKRLVRLMSGHDFASD